MLAVFTVDTIADIGAGSLRDAIVQANSLEGRDEIVFAPELSGQTIKLTSFRGRFEVSDELIVDATSFKCPGRDPGDGGQ